MNWSQRINQLIGAPVGISFTDGTGTSGVLCQTQDGIVYLMEYLYHSQFALKQYPYYMIQDIYSFPHCSNSNNSGISTLPMPIIPPTPY